MEKRLSQVKAARRRRALLKVPTSSLLSFRSLRSSRSFALLCSCQLLARERCVKVFAVFSGAVFLYYFFSTSSRVFSTKTLFVSRVNIYFQQLTTTKTKLSCEVLVFRAFEQNPRQIRAFEFGLLIVFINKLAVVIVVGIWIAEVLELKIHECVHKSWIAGVGEQKKKRGKKKIYSKNLKRKC